VRVGPCSSASALAPLRCWPYCWIFPRQRPGATASTLRGAACCSSVVTRSVTATRHAMPSLPCSTA
jgi:hypothetical protein